MELLPAHISLSKRISAAKMVHQFTGYFNLPSHVLIGKGFAFISYYNRDDAQRAMDNLNGYGYDHLILRVEFSKY